MRSIERLRILNFQSHAATELQFSPGLNVITGQSDNGKTAILRALRWALYNEPGGTEFIRHGTREGKVEVTMSDGTTILRERSHKVNRYVVTAPGAEPQVFEGFGTRVPAEVLKAHGMTPVALDTDHKVLLNVGTQLEGPFLLSAAPSVRAKAIGRLLGVHVVDAAARTARKDLQQKGREERAAEAELARLEQELQAFAPLPAWEQALAAAEAAYARARELERRVALLQDLAARLTEVDGALARGRELLGQLRAIYPAEQHYEAARAGAERLRTLDGLGSEFRARTAELEQTRRILTATAHVQSADRQHHEAQEGARRLAGLEELLARWDDNRERLDRGRQYLARLVAVPQAEARCGAAEARYVRLRELTPLPERWQRLHADLAAARGQMERAAHAEAGGAPLQGAQDRAHRLAQLAPVVAQLAAWQQAAAQNRAVLADSARLLRSLAAEYDALLQAAGRCPTCLSPVTPDTLRRIVLEIAPGEVASDAG